MNSGPARPVDPSSRALRPSPRPRVRTAFLVTVALAISTALVGFAGSAVAAPKPAVAKVPPANVAAATTPTHSKTPPANPTDTQINAAAAAKSQAASDVGRLSGLIVGINARIGHLNDVAELAGERYLQARWKLGLAKTAAIKAQKAVVAAQKNFDNARARFRLYIAAAYMNRSGDSSGLLTAQNPNILLERNDLGRYTSIRQLDAIGSMTRATVAKANAVSRARTAVSLRTKLTGEANTARIVAGRAVASAKAQRVTLVAQRGRYEGQLTAAGEALTGLKNKRAAYLQWQKIEAQIKAAAARRARIARAKLLAAQARERARLIRVAQQQAKQRRDQEAAQRRNASHKSHNSSGNSSGNSPSSNGSSNTGSNNSGGSDNSGSGNGSWTPAKGRAAVARAERWLGTPYSFAAGNANGPTYGVCSYSNACHVLGFDCSGLSLYAWAGSGVYLDHYTVSQYLGAGSVHPSIDQLQPGDLVFWSTGGVSGIHHVAIYVGNGNVIEAPHTGDVVKYAPLWMNGYYGATRPGT